MPKKSLHRFTWRETTLYLSNIMKSRLLDIRAKALSPSVCTRLTLALKVKRHWKSYIQLRLTNYPLILARKISASLKKFHKWNYKIAIATFGEKFRDKINKSKTNDCKLNYSPMLLKCNQIACSWNYQKISLTFCQNSNNFPRPKRLGKIIRILTKTRMKLFPDFTRRYLLLLWRTHE